ncbi:MAG: DUF5666 domain-containing protein [Burkholderiaceae bacterium]|jgi:hypothetical protein|nr:DUF5666 domain-containing protein [Burkholderiaceae bacterium]
MTPTHDARRDGARSTQRAALAAAALALTLAACGGGTDGTGGSPPLPVAAPITASGVMTKGSVIVNGLRYDDSSATVTDDRGRGAAQLADGMVVRLRGRSDDNVNGTAERIDVENELRAAITAIDAAASPQRFVAGGLTVIVDSRTVYANVAGFAALAVGTRVEVHGLRDASGALRAARVEAVGAAGAANGVDELRGAVSALNTTADSFVLNGSITVNYAGATFSPAGSTEAALSNGAVVEVRGSLAGSVFTATQIDIEDLEDDNLRGRANEKQELEGFVTGFTAHPGSFNVAGRSVRTTASTRFVGGAAADLVNNAKVEAEGVIDAQGVLVASRIEFRNLRVILHGRVTAVSTAARTIVVLGQTVQANDLTRIDTRGSGGNSTSLADLAAGVDCVEVRATLDGSTLVAEEIKEPSGCSRELVQARVSAENESASTLTFFGSLNASVAGNAVFRDINGAAITRAQFFAAVVPASGTTLGTLVKLRGNTLAAVDEAELED